MLTNEYLKRVYEGLAKRNANEPEFLQAVRDARIHDAMDPNNRAKNTDGTVTTIDPKNAEIILPSTSTVLKFSRRCHLLGKLMLGTMASACVLPAVTTSNQNGIPNKTAITMTTRIP